MLHGILDRANLVGQEGGFDHAEVVRFLSQPDSYPDHPENVQIIESHMSLLFMTEDRVYKLKRPIKLDFVDFTTLDARRTSCEQEFAINQQLAPGVYLQILPIVRDAGGRLTLDGTGETVDWLVCMRRLDCAQALDCKIARNEVEPADIEILCKVLAGFYQSQPAIDVAPEAVLRRWEDGVKQIESALTDPLFALPSGLVDPPLEALLRFLAKHGDLLAERVENGRLLDGHGDLKPEHIYLGPPILLIDRLEFDEKLRWCDPFDEITFLGVECAILGAPWIAQLLQSEMARLLDEQPAQELLRFYWCYRACLRARLSIEHLRDEAPRTPARWPRQTRAYLRLAGEALSGMDAGPGTRFGAVPDHAKGNSSLTGSP
ncbi:hypothetical protein [Aurantiacibacter marinus]|uniref:hypothetical protein n=1 Tax=Aurantiacibacter marinus TaxID=874156 RepID=UPI0012E01965|nr:hypothetical protein [Aurantiacibacter marinus]